MQFSKLIKKLLSVAISISACCILISTAQASIVVIGNLKVQVSALTKDQVANFYLGKPVSLSTKEKLQPYGQPLKTIASQQFYKTVLNWGVGDVSSYWSSQVFSGQANQPTVVSDDEAAIATVQKTPNAIAYVDSTSLQGSNDYQVKILYGSIDLPPPDQSQANAAPSQPLLGNSTGLGYHGPNQQAQIQPTAVQNSMNSANPQSGQNYPNAQIYSDISKQLSDISNNLNAGNVWSVIQSNLQYGQEANNPDVRQQVLWFLNNRNALNMILNNATPFIYYVYQETQKRNMPAIFTLLPLIESGYNPYSYSHAGAAGLWQMMPGTASSYNLDIDWWYDGRRDVMTSTNAALNFLVELKQGLGDWYLAAAAYDAGQGAVQAAMQTNIRNHLPTDFWSLPLPEETREYVPRLLALAVIIKNADRYGVQLPNVPNQPFFVAIAMNSQLDLDEIAQLAGVSVSYIHRLNPGIRRFATASDGQYSLLIPSSRAQMFIDNLSRIAGKTHMSWQYHEVHSGETLALISKNYHVNIDSIRQVNGLPATADVEPNQDILVPIWLNKAYQKAVGVVWPQQQGAMTAQQPAVASPAMGMLTPASLEAMDNSNPITVGFGENNSIQKTIMNQTKSVPSFGNSANTEDTSLTNATKEPINDSDSLKTLISKIYGHG